MEIPKNIKIGGKIFEITIRNDVKDGLNDQGNSSNWSQKIWLNSNQHQEALEETFFHEIIEIIKVANELNIEHQDISTLTENLYQVLKDNNLLK